MTKKQKNKTSQIESTIMSKINSGEIRMRSHWYFGLLGFLSVLISALLGFLAVYASSIVILWIRVVSIDGPALGIRNKFGELLLSFPWWAILLIVISAIILFYTVNRFGHLYKIKPILLLPLAIILVIIFGFASSYTNLPNILNTNNRSNNQCEIGDENCSMGSRIYRKMRQMK